jgi:V-type H+-transporting ATPase subunit E
MADSKVTSQLNNMVKFIEKEANEKAQEIRDKTLSEYTIEKAKIVMAQKEKITVEINRKQQQVLVDKRMYAICLLLVLISSAHSHEITKFRLEILQVREKGVRSVVNKATAKLNELSHGPQYKPLLVRLILQVCSCLRRFV